MISKILHSFLCVLKTRCFWVLLSLVWSNGATAQNTRVVSLTKQAKYNYNFILNFDTVTKASQKPPGIRRYLIKYIVFGGTPGQPPAQRFNFLIGRDTQGRIVFVPAAAVNSLDFRSKDQQVLPAAFGTTAAVPIHIRIQGLHGPLVLELNPVVYPEYFKYLRYTSTYKNDLYLLLEYSSTVGGTLPIGGANIPFQAANTGVPRSILFTDSLTQLSVLDGQHDKQVYRMGETCLVNGQPVTFQHINSTGDSLTVKLADPGSTPLVYGNYPGLAFQPTVLTDLQGQRVSLNGTERPLILDFWGTWCGPCVALTPNLKALHQQYAAKADIVSIAYDDRRKSKAT